MPHIYYNDELTAILAYVLPNIKLFIASTILSIASDIDPIVVSIIIFKLFLYYWIKEIIKV
jgi:hypothetical protein